MMCQFLILTLCPQSNVFMYYGLSNFYQNHRRYVKSRDDSQLNGDERSLKVLSICLSVCLSIYLSIVLLFYLSFCLSSFCPSVICSINCSIVLYIVHLFVPSTDLSVCQNTNNVLVTLYRFRSIRFSITLSVPSVQCPFQDSNTSSSSWHFVWLPTVYPHAYPKRLSIYHQTWKTEFL